MASLFGNLPAPKRTAEQPNEDKSKKMKDDSHTGSPSCIERKVSGEERCIDDGTVEGSANQADVYTSDQISLAIEKITSHIGQTSRKFLKSSELLRKLLEGSNVEAGKHGSLLFSALVASMVNPDRPLDPMLGREYYKLFCLANSRHELFSDEERSRLEVYHLWAVTRWKITSTDDSFEFSKTTQHVKSLINGLSNISQVERDRLQDSNIEALLFKPVWDEVDLTIARRLALIDCLLATKSVYNKAWASTAIDMLIELAFSSKDRFLALPTYPKLEQLFLFVKEQKLTRRRKTSAQDSSTAFERAGKEWSRASVSHRGKVGSGGDHKSEAWLG